jgi:3-deoxy-D-manno-octulosonic-acid transferase
MTRTEALLALLVLHNMNEASQIDKTVLFSKAGFNNAEIAQLLGTTAAVIAQNLYLARTTKRKKATAKKAPRKAPRKAAKKAPRKTAKKARKVARTP